MGPPSPDVRHLLRSEVTRAWWWLNLKRRLGRYSRKYDIVFCDWADSFAAMVTNANIEVPIVVRLHAYEIDHPELLNAINWERVDALVTVSDHMKRLVDQSPHIHCTENVMIRHGIDLEEIPFKPSDSGLLCTYALFDQPQKRVYDLMLALRKETLHIGGRGTIARALDSAIKRFDLHHVLDGYAKIPDWLWDKEYFFMHSLDESCGVSLLESMASGLICFSHDYEASREILPQRHRYVYDDELLTLLAESRALDRSQRLEVKKGLRNIVETRYDARDQAAQFDALFEKVTEEGR